MKKLLTLAIAGAMGLASSAQAAPGGTIQFKGEIVDAACVVSASTTNFEVNMGQVKKSHLHGATGKEAPNATPFQIKLEECDTTIAQTAAITFTGNAVTSNPGILQTAMASGSASGVGIKIYDHSGAHIPLNSVTPNPVNLVNGSNTLDFSAKYISTATAVTTGHANATADFTFTYN